MVCVSALFFFIFLSVCLSLNVERFWVRQQYDFFSCAWVTICKCFPQTLSHCELITDDGIRQLAAGSCAAESLSVLELDNCPLITDATLDHLISCHNLQRIELYDCQLITRSAIGRLKVLMRICCFWGLAHGSMGFCLCFLSLQNHLPNIKVHAYFAPVTPPPTTGGPRPRYCRCCEILWDQAVGLARKILCKGRDDWYIHL